MSLSRPWRFAIATHFVAAEPNLGIKSPVRPSFGVIRSRITVEMAAHGFLSPVV
jgi:hypothetical protein